MADYDNRLMRGAATLLFGLFGAIAALNARPAQRLRNA